MKLSDLFMILWLGVLAYGLFIFVVPTQRELTEKQQRLEELSKEKKAQDQQMARLIKETTELDKGNPYRMTQVARETFNLCYPGEKIYHFPENKEK